MGVYEIQYHSGKSLFEARVTLDKKVHILGKFDTLEDAAAAYKRAEVDYDRGTSK
jgi:hypothetical protein